MVINLLPADQKSKIKKQQPPVSSHIELTGPEKVGKKEPGIKKAGVLMFFKTAFQKPKKDVLKEEREKVKRLPEKKVIYREKIIIEKPEQKARPKVEFHEPTRKPESLKIKPSIRLGEKIGGFFSSLFKGKPTAPKKVEEKLEVSKKPFIPEEQFPKYKKEKLEEILPKPEGVPRKPEVIELLAEKVEVKKEEPKKKTGSVWQRFRSWLKGIFRKKSLKVLPKPIPKSLVSKEEIPGYKPVKAEKILPLAAIKLRQPEVIKVITDQKIIAKEKPKKKGKSLWQRFSDWLKGIFSKKPKGAVPPPPLKEPVEPGKLPHEEPIVIQREERVVIPPAKEEQSQAEIQKKIGKPVEPREKEELFSYATPLPPLEPEEKKTEQKVMLKYEAVKSPAFAAPQKDDIKKKIEEKEKFVPTPPAQKQPVKKSFSLAAWFAKLWKTISGLFKRKKVSVVSATQEKSHKEETREKIEKIPVIEKEVKAPSFVLPPVPPPPKPETKEEKPEEVSSMVNEKKEREAKKEEQKKEEIPVPLPPIAEGTKGQSFRLTRSEEGQMKLTQPKETIKKPSDMDWEVNLIPEEALEKEISLSKILYLVMSLIVACALVFGGWLWANYYYNEISITINEISSEISIKNLEIGHYQQLQKDVSALRQKIGSAQGLLNKHVYWSEIFNKLEEHTISGVYFKSMTADINGSVALLAVGKDYETAVRQLFVFNQASDFVTDITISNIVFVQESAAPVITSSSEETITPAINGEESVTFTVNLSILPSIFYYSQ